MSIRDILTYPDPFLEKATARVVDFDLKLQELIDDMADTMYDAPGVGLAANQIGENLSLLIYDPDADPEKRNFSVLINPEIIEAEGAFLSENEGCLSVPGLRSDVDRYDYIKVKAQNEKGEDISVELKNFEAVIVQHEMDHLAGTLFIDRISSLKRNLYKKRVAKKLRKEKI